VAPLKETQNCPLKILKKEPHSIFLNSITVEGRDHSVALTRNPRGEFRKSPYIMSILSCQQSIA
jgi:hypothetical protein